MIVCAGGGEAFPFAKSIGIGLVDSAIGLSRICLQKAPKSLIFIGSAGSYDSNVAVGSLFFSTRATQIELSLVGGQAYTPIDNSISMDSASFVLHETMQSHGILEATVNSSNYITATSAYNKRMLAAGLMLENMEFFSVLRVAEYFQIPAWALLCVSNTVGEGAHEAWIASRDIVASRLENALRNTLKIL